jgi:hypothetical protein
MARLLHDQNSSELDVAGLHHPIGLERLLQRHGPDLRAHAGQDTEVQRLLVLVGRAGDRSEHAALADDEVAGRHGERGLARAGGAPRRCPGLGVSRSTSSSVPGVVTCMERYVAFTVIPRILKGLPTER